ncbi:MAG: hypothetical protein ABI384_07605, partial [Allobranchiibius sp.]
MTDPATPTPEDRRRVSAVRADHAWALDPRVVLRVVPRDGVYVLRGEDTVLLRGAAYEAVAPLINGRRTSDDVVDALDG